MCVSGFIGDKVNRKEPNNWEPGTLLSEFQTLPWDTEIRQGDHSSVDHMERSGEYL